jgi:hypothetical protein
VVQAAEHGGRRGGGILVAVKQQEVSTELNARLAKEKGNVPQGLIRMGYQRFRMAGYPPDVAEQKAVAALPEEFRGYVPIRARR